MQQVITTVPANFFRTIIFINGDHREWNYGIVTSIARCSISEM